MAATGVFVRRSEFDDHPAILALIGDEAHILNKRFGRFDVTNMIENATLGITAVDGEGKVLGYAAFFDYPALTPSVDPTTWPEWLEETHGHPEFTSQNSLWLAFFIADHLYEAEVSENILRTAFTTLPEIDVFLLALPVDQRLFPPMRQSFEYVPHLDGSAEPPCKVHACPRGLYIPNLLVRAARVEDHDDLVPVFNQQSEVLQARYGEFFLAEVISAQDAKSQALVAEADGHAVGLLALTSEIDVRMLDDYFELEPFDGLLRPDPDAPAQPARARARAGASARAREGGEDLGEAGDGGGEADADDAFVSIDRSSWLPNAFAITLFCLDESAESRAIDLLRPAFALFPGLEYCIVTLPHVTAEFGLLSLFTMVHARSPADGGDGGDNRGGDNRGGDGDDGGAGASSSSFGHVLYVFHRAALGGQLTVREARSADVAGARALCEGLHDSAAIVEAVEATSRLVIGGGYGRPPSVAFVVECQAQVVGVATVTEQGVDVESLKRHYSLEDYILFSEHDSSAHAQLEHFVINPVFHSSSRFVLKEVFRRARKSVLYLQLRHDAPLPDIAAQFVEVRPRRQIQLPQHLARAARADALALGGSDGAPPDSALLFLTRKLISEPKIQNNVRIVVVGGRDTSIAFLETLLAVPYLHFSSITLVAPYGLPDGTALPAQPARDDGGKGVGSGSAALGTHDEPAIAPGAFSAASLCYTRRELRQLGLDARVTVIRAHLADIDRSRKLVELAGRAERVPYDVLLLAPPLHDQTLAGLSEASRAVGGAFSVSGGQVERDVDHFLRSTAWARRSALPDCAAFVYGATLSAYCSLNALLERGVDADKLCIVLPPGAPTPFADPRVDARVRETLDRLGIAVLEDLALRDVRAGIDGSISSVVLVDAHGEHERELPCALLLTADVPDVDDAIFRACNSNSLVYDGRLVIDARFRTSDPSIYAAGPLTKFARRYRGGINLEHYDKRDVGVKVAHSLLPLLDPLSAGALGAAGGAAGGGAAGAAGDALPTFSQPRGEGAMLPGGLLYMHVQRPAKPIPYDELMRSGSVGRELTTVSNGGSDYCCFRIDKYELIDAITYLGESPLEVSNMKQLIGIPQMYCNRLISRYNEGLVPDLPQFLRDSWAVCLFHDRFADFRTALKGELLEEDAFAAIAADLQERLEMEIELPSREELRAAVQASSRQLVEKRLVEYLQTNQNQLSMYLVPSAPVMRQMEDKDLINGMQAVAS